MMSSKEMWREIGDRFAPFEPAKNPLWRVERKGRPAQEISRQLGIERNRHHHILLLGPVGSGKSTELLSIAEQRAQAEDFVVTLDVGRHFEDVVRERNAIHSVEAWEILFLIGLSLLRHALSAGIAKEFLEEHAKSLAIAWQTLAEQSATPNPIALDMGGVFEAAQLLVPAFMIATGADASTTLALSTGTGVFAKLAKSIKNWFLPMGHSKKPMLDQDPATQGLQNAVHALLTEVRAATQSRRLLIIIDGLDRIKDFQRAETLLLQSEIITSLPCSLVISGPYSLYRNQPAARTSRYTKFFSLYNEAVSNKNEPWKDGPGIPVLLNLYKKRIADIQGAESLIAEPWLRHLAYYSGGHSREFIQLISTLADEALAAGASQANEELITKTLNDSREPLEAFLHSGQIDLLQHIINTPNHTLPDSPFVSDLLDTFRLFVYRNDKEWCFPHTLLTMHCLSMPTQRAKPQLP